MCIRGPDRGAFAFLLLTEYFGVVVTVCTTCISLLGLHNEELNDLYSSPNIVRVIKPRRLRWAGHVARMEEGRGVQKVLVGKPEGKGPLGRPRRRWKDNIKIDREEVGWGGGDWLELAEDRDGWRAVMNLRVP